VTAAFAAWQHRGARDGFEVLFLRAGRAEGDTAAVEDGEAWSVRYDISLDAEWRTRGARISGRAAGGSRDLHLEADGDGHWRIDGRPAPHLDGCLDVDLESSAFTNALPVQRLELQVGERAHAPAAYVRARDLAVERLEQSYLRLDERRYRYSAPRFDFSCELVYDESGLVLDYPGLATRVRP
jgi:uncharacterized protein